MDSDFEPEEDGSWSDQSMPGEKSAKNKRKKNVKVSKARKSSSTTSAVNSEYIKDIKQVFERFDSKKDGKIDSKQLKFAIRALGFEPRKEDIKKISEEYCKNGFIFFDDFVDLMVKRFTEKNVNEEIMKAFQLFDANQNGKITFKDLKRVCEELDEKITDEELMEMIEEADLNGDNAVDSQEFLRIMKKTSLY